MTEYQFITKPTQDQIKGIIALYRQAGWWARDDDSSLVEAIVAGSHCFLLALDGNDVIGMGRAISDRVSDAYIQDVTVHNLHRHTGVGSRLIEIISARLRNDGIKWIGLIAERDSAPFYQKQGFVQMPASVPMVMKYYE